MSQNKENHIGFIVYEGDDHIVTVRNNRLPKGEYEQTLQRYKEHENWTILYMYESPSLISNDIIDELKKHELGIKNGLNLHMHECEECPTEENDCMECEECEREDCNCFSHPIANLCFYIKSLIKVGD